MDVWVRKKEGVKNDPRFLDWTSKTGCQLVKLELKEGEKGYIQFWTYHALDIFMGRCLVGGWKVIWKLGRLIWIEVKV